MALPPLLTVARIRERLGKIFLDGTPNRNYVTREMAAKTVFVMLYIGAVVGKKRWMRPDQVTRMTDAQAALAKDPQREAWLIDSMLPSTGNIDGRWYAGNTREPIRDETLRDGLVRLGAVKMREGLPTTSPKPRYAMAKGFAALFHPNLSGKAMESQFEQWRAANLSSRALMRVSVLQDGAVAQRGQVLVTFPNGEVRQMEPGPSSVISKAVVEQFAHRFLKEPAVIWLSESRRKVVMHDDKLARQINLEIEPDLILPDLILADIDPNSTLLVFVEVVASAGQVGEMRRGALMSLASNGGFSEDHVAFLSAYADRNHAAFKSSVSELEWGSFAWFASEPDQIIILHRGRQARQAVLAELMQEPLG